jgi:hemolysin III
MWQVLPPAALFLVSVGGIIYSVGAWVFAKPAFRFQNAIWHSFVLSASTCFFAAVAIALQVG